MKPKLQIKTKLLNKRRFSSEGIMNKLWKLVSNYILGGQLIIELDLKKQNLKTPLKTPQHIEMSSLETV